jgi:hypothetical protein
MMEILSGEKQSFRSWDYSSNARLSGFLDVGLKEFFCNLINYKVYETKSISCQMLIAITPFMHSLMNYTNA